MAPLWKRAHLRPPATEKILLDRIDSKESHQKGYWTRGEGGGPYLSNGYFGVILTIRFEQNYLKIAPSGGGPGGGPGGTGARRGNGGTHALLAMFLRKSDTH